MKSLFALIFVLFASTSAFASNALVCENDYGTVKVRLAGLDSDDSAVMVISDPRVTTGRKTIARFTEANNTLKRVRNGVIGRVDLRRTDSNRGGEYIGGTRLANVKEVVLQLNDTGDGTSSLIIFGRNGKNLVLRLNCGE